MNIIRDASEKEMLDYWRECENIPPDKPVRTDIRHQGFPRNAAWYKAEIESEDIAKLFLISVGDFGPISRKTWRVSVAATHYVNGFQDDDHSLRFQKLLAQPSFDPRVIAVTDVIGGPYTIIDGNHRAIILRSRNQLVGQHCFLGIHKRFRQFDHAQMSYRNYPIRPEET